MRTLFVIAVAAVVVSVAGAVAQNPPPPVTWDNGYPSTQNAPPFGTHGTVEVFGSFNGGALGFATGAYFEWVPQAGGTPTTHTLDYSAAGIGKFGKKNVNNVVAPTKISLPKGSYTVKVVVLFTKANPNQPPPTIVTPSQTNYVNITIN